MSVGDFEELARCGFRIGVGARFDKLVHQGVLA
jgi:hypothetical protein